MRRYVFLALLITACNAHALQSLRIGSQVLVVGDSAARVRELLGDPAVHAKGAAPSKKGSRKGGSSKSSGKRAPIKAAAKDQGEAWQYRRGGHTTTFTIVGGKIAHIEDVAR
ncbi:hypothetical protein ISP15_07095 [Dyella jejuensis]|uniref:DUF2845 domain-containing protein n=1 Tax=Dyella jejuensis TaxID=1432009 RepID=A0ABW8JIM5_9GAMM